MMEIRAEIVGSDKLAALVQPVRVNLSPSSMLSMMSYCCLRFRRCLVIYFDNAVAVVQIVSFEKYYQFE